MTQTARDPRTTPAGVATTLRPLAEVDPEIAAVLDAELAVEHALELELRRLVALAPALGREGVVSAPSEGVDPVDVPRVVLEGE